MESIIFTQAGHISDSGIYTIMGSIMILSILIILCCLYFKNTRQICISTCTACTNHCRSKFRENKDNIQENQNTEDQRELITRDNTENETRQPIIQQSNEIQTTVTQPELTQLPTAETPPLPMRAARPISIQNATVLNLPPKPKHLKNRRL